MQKSEHDIQAQISICKNKSYSLRFFKTISQRNAEVMPDNLLMTRLHMLMSFVVSVV